MTAPPPKAAIEAVAEALWPHVIAWEHAGPEYRAEQEASRANVRTVLTAALSSGEIVTRERHEKLMGAVQAEYDSLWRLGYGPPEGFNADPVPSQAVAALQDKLNQAIEALTEIDEQEPKLGDITGWQALQACKDRARAALDQLKEPKK